MNPNIDRICRIVFIAAVCTLYGQYAAAQRLVSPPATEQQLADRVDEYMNAAVKLDHFTGSILIARDGRAIVSKGFGMANYELNVPNTPQTVFRLGSVTKQFTSMAIMQLQERGKLNVNDPICKYLDNCPAAWQPVSIRNLLTHTSGIPNYTSFPGFIEKTSTQPFTFAGFVDVFRDKPLEFAPGEKFAYSNSGYYLLGLIVERASGKPYADYLRENIFGPLEMKHSGYDDSRSLVSNRANGYKWAGKSFVNAASLNMVIPFAAGALYSTTEDLLLWDKALNTDKLLPLKSRDEIFTPFKDGYGYGWVIGKKFDRQVVEHSGGINGFSSDIIRFPAEHVTVVALSNNEGSPSERIAGDLSAIVFGEPYGIPAERKAIAIKSEILEKYVGQYQLPQIAPNFIITIANENGKFTAQPTGSTRAELFAESETDFFLKVIEAQITFVKDAQGTVTGLIFHQNGRSIPGQKIR